MARFKLFLTYIYNFQSKFCFFFICSPFPQFHLLRRFVFFFFWVLNLAKENLCFDPEFYSSQRNTLFFIFAWFTLKHTSRVLSWFRALVLPKKKGNQKHCQGIVSIYDCINYITYIWDRLLFSLSLTKKIQLFTNRCFFR